MLSNEVLHAVINVAGLVALPMVMTQLDVFDGGREISLRPPLYLALVFIGLALIAARTYWKHWKSNEGWLFPNLSKMALLGIPLQVVLAGFVLTSEITVTRTTLTILTIRTVIAGPTHFELANLKSISLEKAADGSDVLIVTPKAGSTTVFKFDGRMERILPLLAVNALAKGVAVKGF